MLLDLASRPADYDAGEAPASSMAVAIDSILRAASASCRVNLLLDLFGLGRHGLAGAGQVGDVLLELG